MDNYGFIILICPLLTVAEKIKCWVLEVQFSSPRVSDILFWLLPWYVTHSAPKCNNYMMMVIITPHDLHRRLKRHQATVSESIVGHIQSLWILVFLMGDEQSVIYGGWGCCVLISIPLARRSAFHYLRLMSDLVPT